MAYKNLLRNWPWNDDAPAPIILHSKKVNIGKFSLRTDVKKLPDFNTTLSVLSESLSRCNDLYYLKFSTVTRDPVPYYQRLTALFRHLNNGRWRKEPVGGLRLCNVVQRFDRWRFTCNVICSSSRYSAVVFSELADFLHHTKTIYVTFNKPRKSQIDFIYRKYYAEFFERSHLLESMFKIDILEPYFWKIHHCDTPYLIQILFEIYGPKIDKITTDYFNGVEISRSSNLDPDDYFVTDRHRCGCRVRYLQSFGTLFNILKR